MSAAAGRTRYYYDDVDRVTEIRHETGGGTVRHKTEYMWNADNTVASRTETDNAAGTVAEVTFAYDARQRLISETRVSDATTVYEMAYTYDQLGNRKSKSEHRLIGEATYQDLYTAYTYDTDDGFVDDEFMTRNNRLERCEVYAGDDDAGPLLRTVKYLYYKTGDVSNITVKDEYVDPNVTPGDPNDYQWYNDLALYYDKGRNVRMVLRGRWKSDGDGGFEDYERRWSREFMYDNPRARFMARELDPDTFDPLLGSENPWHWTDYAGVTPTLDLELRAVAADPNQLTVTEKRSYGPGGWQDLAYDPNDPNAPPMVVATRYTHGDLIDSTVLTTDESAAAIATAAYTAFGERIGVGSVGVPPANMETRYRYAGGHGYEADLLHGAHAPLSGPNPTLAPVTLLHVGARWYDPSIGRFVQRDPIGLGGGLNSYCYVHNSPVAELDPTGEGLYKWIYTGNWNASDAEYDDAVDAAGQWLNKHSPVRGGYVGVGTKNNRGAVAGAGACWTIDDGAAAYAGLGFSKSRRSRDPRTGKFMSHTGAIGGVIGYGENGWIADACFATGMNKKANGGHGMQNATGTICIGINVGIMNGGIIIRVCP